MSFTTIEQVLQMQGGALVKVPKTVFMEKIKAAKALAIAPDSIVSAVLGGNLASVLQNPMAAVSGLLNGSINSIMSGVGAGVFSSALSTLQTSLTTLTNHVNGLTGMDFTQSFNIMDLMGHANLADLVGVALPSNLQLGNLLTAIGSSPQLTSMQSTLLSLQAQVDAHTMTQSQAATNVSSVQQPVLDALYNNSVNAITGLRTITPMLSSMFGVMGMISCAQSKYSGVDSQYTTVLRSMVQPLHLTAMDSFITQTFPVPPVAPEPGAGLE